MMGRAGGIQEALFTYQVSLDARIRKDHPLRKIQKIIDFDFIYKEVERFYGGNGNVSVPPPIILKMMFLLFFYNVRSERELIDTIPERLDWLWFLGYTLDDEIPNHSVLSKARTKWGADVFRTFFERIVLQCVEAGLVDGSKLFVDASLIDANASNNSVVNRHSLKRYLNKHYVELEERLDEKSTPRYISTTDPDAAIVHYRGSKSKVRYKTHRGVDPAHEVITATKITKGNVDDGAMLDQIILQHEGNTEERIDTVVADSRYGITENYLKCHDRGIHAHIPCLEKTYVNTGKRKGIFAPEQFMYDAERDIFICPTGQILRRKNFHASRNTYEYRASKKSCHSCALKDKCTRSRNVRSVTRHIRQDELDRTRTEAQSRQAKRDIKTRQDLSERSFAKSTRYGFKRARWRGIQKIEIQDYLIATIQNIMVLFSQRSPKEKAFGKHKTDRLHKFQTSFACIFCIIIEDQIERLVFLTPSFLKNIITTLIYH